MPKKKNPSDNRLTPAQKAILTVYEGGEFSYMAEDPSYDSREVQNGLGDGLLTTVLGDIDGELDRDRILMKIDAIIASVQECRDAVVAMPVEAAVGEGS